MRNAFVAELESLAKNDDRLFLLTADLGWSVLERFAEQFPDRFLNVGVAEQNMIGIATGLAQEGYIPFVYSIATFASMRGYEQIRNGPVLHHLPVRVIGIGGGYAYGHAGPTHCALEDIAIARAQPGMHCIVPADPDQCRSALWQTLNEPHPIYFRVGKGGNPPVPALVGRFALDTPEVVRDGTDVLYLTTGTVVHEALKAAELLKTSGVSAAVAVQAHVSFTGSPELRDLLADFPFVVSVEEGYAAGGLGSLVAETIAEAGLACRLSIQGVRTRFHGGSGSAPYMLEQAGLDGGFLAAIGRRQLLRRKAA